MKLIRSLAFAVALMLALAACGPPEITAPPPFEFNVVEEACDGGSSLVVELPNTHDSSWMSMENSFYFGALRRQAGSSFNTCQPAGEQEAGEDEAVQAGSAEASDSGSESPLPIKVPVSPQVQLPPHGFGLPKPAFGVLVQLGMIEEGFWYHVVELTLENGETKELTKENFDWLNADTGTGRRIDPVRAYTLFPNDVVTVQCDWAIESNPGVSQSCFRARRLHPSMKPRGIMTLWNETTYSVDVAPVDASSTSPHPVFAFRFCGKFTVDQWKDGCFVERYENVTKIRHLRKLLQPEPGVPFGTKHPSHNPFHDSPLDGGGIVIPPPDDDTIGPG